jgi:hypothetical protein
MTYVSQKYGTCNLGVNEPLDKLWSASGKPIVEDFQISNLEGETALTRSSRPMSICAFVPRVFGPQRARKAAKLAAERDDAAGGDIAAY